MKCSHPKLICMIKPYFRTYKYLHTVFFHTALKQSTDMAFFFKNEGVKIDIKSPEAEVAENAEELQEAENQAEETDMGGVFFHTALKQSTDMAFFFKSPQYIS